MKTYMKKLIMQNGLFGHKESMEKLICDILLDDQ